MELRRETELLQGFCVANFHLFTNLSYYYVIEPVLPGPFSTVSRNHMNVTITFVFILKNCNTGVWPEFGKFLV